MYQNITNSELKNLIKQPNTIVIDVRTAKEIAEGYITGTKEFADINNAGEFAKTIQRIDKSKNYVVYCRSGARSAKACSLMEMTGFKGTLYNLALGFSQWNGEKTIKAQPKL
jgi:rhodanese-related sulfurtransferase